MQGHVYMSHKYVWLPFLVACFSGAIAVATDEDAYVPNEVIAWVSFGRVGSTTMREVLHHRARLKHYRHYEGPDGLCHNKPLNWTAPASEKLQCEDVEQGYVVQTEYGFCQRLNNSRPCRYMTLLRSPLDMMISEYNWFCKDCMEGGKQCVAQSKQIARRRFLKSNPQNTPQLTCPNMQITDYAKHYRNQYTMQFSGKKIFCSRTGESQNSVTFRDCSETLTEVDFQAALQTLTHPAFLVLRLETLWEGIPGVSPSGITKMANFLRDPDLSGRAEVHRNGHNKSYVPTEEEVVELRRILSFDIRLYEEMKRREELKISGEYQPSEPSADDVLDPSAEGSADPLARRPSGSRRRKRHGSRRRGYKWRRHLVHHGHKSSHHRHSSRRLHHTRHRHNVPESEFTVIS